MSAISERTEWSVAQVAELLETPQRLVERWCKVGLLEARIRKGEWSISAEALRVFCMRKVEPHYSTRTISLLLDNEESTVREWIEQGRMLKRKFGGARSSPVRVPESELIRWMAL